jgi:RNA polymerase sigma-70 factor (ECF subfamily)
MHLRTNEIEALIAELPLGYRTVFNLYAIEGYTHDEIATQLNISAGTSKSQLSRARTLIQQKLKLIES